MPSRRPLPLPRAVPPVSAKVLRQPIEAANNPAALLRLDTVAALTGLSRSTLYAKIKAGTFPAPIKQGARCTRFRASTVTAWLESVN
ncbi:helix-turn-helix transcriptional regulator [Variovorax sp. PAMC 28711]|uniref:helix-turn-helix transcriptional regulator n=1 Tax=Variovorax sp. PAMC 28711 TaxID=1795631 RepID=UPI0009EB80A8|nr:AlpA family phage regulatory protein [Variovorax sp. PAMC 28711]